IDIYRGTALRVMADLGLNILPQDNRAEIRFKPTGIYPMGYQQAEPGILAHHFKPIKRVVWIQRYIRGTCFEYADYTRNHFQRAIQAYAHAIPSCNAPTGKIMGYFVG